MSEPRDPASPPDPPDLGRRSFFRHFGRSAVQAAGQVAGAADAIRRGTSAATSELLELGLGDPQANAARLAGANAASTGLAGSAQAASGGTGLATGSYRSPYRLAGQDALVMLDRRALPERISEMEARDAGEVARAIRAGAVRGGPLLAQLAAYGLTLTAQRHVSDPVAKQLGAIAAASAVLRRTEPTARAMRGALERIAERLAVLDPDATPDAVVDAIRATADAIAIEATEDHAALARHGAQVLPRHKGRRPVRVLLHGGLGPMDAGIVGTGLAILQLMAAEHRPVQVWVTEGRPSLDGARVTTWQLDQVDVPYSVLPDSAVVWLLDRHDLDAVLLTADWIAADGSCASAVGSGAIAALASTSADPPVPVYVCAPVGSIGLDAADGPAIPRSSATRASAEGVAPQSGRQVVAPTIDIVRPGHVTAFITDEGVRRPPFGDSLADAVEARRLRRVGVAASNAEVA